ncbi:MAG: hypothetical protein MZV64_45620 [Ignavibacteriales bacterium]|nr:hypothetical protein [Ignavibacteriales bacterium]
MMTLLQSSPLPELKNLIAQFGMPNTQQFVVRGIFSSKNNEYDEALAFTYLE